MLAAFLAVAVACLGPAARAATAGDRVVVAVVGDSVSEGYTTPKGLTRAFVPNLAAALERRGFSAGGVGLVPAMPYRWSFSHPVDGKAQTVPANGWRLAGFGVDVLGLDGPSTYSAQAVSPAATAVGYLSGPDVRLLFTSTDTPTPFQVTAGRRTWKLDSYAPGPARPVGFSLTLPRGVHVVKVQGPSQGMLTFVGAMDRVPPPGGSRIQVEVDNLAHAGLLPQNSLAPRVLDSISALSPDVTLFAWGYVAELIIGANVGPGDLGDRYEFGLLARARLARRDGGRCVIADTSPVPIEAKVRRRFTAIHKRVAREAGCVYTAVLSNLWSSPSTAFERGLTQVDNVHPSPRGYRMMAEALAPTLKRLALARLAQRRAAAARGTG
jgi:hypothetical protein